jgi:hypothetical protein
MIIHPLRKTNLLETGQRSDYTSSALRSLNDASQLVNEHQRLAL